MYVWICQFKTTWNLLHFDILFGPSGFLNRCSLQTKKLPDFSWCQNVRFILKQKFKISPSQQVNCLGRQLTGVPKQELRPVSAMILWHCNALWQEKQWDKIVLSKLTSTHTAFSLANIVSFLFWSQQWTWRHRLSGEMITAQLCNCTVDKMSSVLMIYWEKYLRDWRKYIWGTRRNALLHLEEIHLEFNYCHSKYVYTFRPIAK